MSTEKNSCHGRSGTAKSKKAFRSVCGSFIQPWLAESWSEERWTQELAAMKRAGMRYIILQSVADRTFNTDEDLGEDSSLYTVVSRVCLYPSQLPEFAGVNTGTDSLGNCLKACRKLDMQAIIGPLSDSRWWKYGWEIPACPTGCTDPVKDSYFTVWVRENADLSNRIADEILTRYREYAPQIYCWYYNNEIWNMQKPCKGRDHGVYAKILAESMNRSLAHYSSMPVDKPMLLSSFINPLLSTPEELSRMWIDIFADTAFRPGDIFCPQDSFGNNTTQDLDAWTRCYAEAVKTKPGLRLWANNECFRCGLPAPIEDFARQVEITARYCEANICFSWNHYYAPTEKHPGYGEAFARWNTAGSLKKTDWFAPTVLVDGRRIQVEAADNGAIRTVYIYRVTGTEPVITVHCRDDGRPIGGIDVEEAGEYFAQTVDFYGSASPKTAFRIR